MAKSEEKVKKSTKKTTKKATVKKNTKKIPKESYLKKTKKELKLVKWPSFKEVIKYTISTIIFCIVLSALFMLLNFVLSIIKGWLV